MKFLKYKDLKIFNEKLNKDYINYDILIKKIIENKKVLIICGPTCIGKTEIAINLASILKTNIISLDSIQVYKGMNIGTDKYTTEKYGIKQFMVDIINPDKVQFGLSDETQKDMFDLPLQPEEECLMLYHLINNK